MGRASRRKKDLVPKIVKGRIHIIRVLKYLGVNVLIRKIDEDIFEYVVVIDDNFYSDYMIFAPKQGSKTLTPTEVNNATQIILSGAFATIETILGKEQDAAEKARAEEFLTVGAEAFGDEKDHQVITDAPKVAVAES